LSPKEALGGRFDALWVTGLDDLNWPGPAEPDPLIPLPEQLGCPSSTAEGSVEIAEVTLSRLAASASVAEQAGDIRVGSFSAVRDEMPMRLSGLVVDTSCSASDMLGVKWRSYPEKAVLECVGEDVRGAPHPAGRVRGGTQVLKQQAACPFRAFAVHRLGAEAVPSPTVGLSRLDRGNVAHDVLEGFWKKFGSLQAVQAESDESVRQTLSELAAAALRGVLKRNPLAIDDEGFALEVERVCERVFELIDQEKQRPDFEVVETEEAKQVCIGDLEFNLKIDRVDRIDGGLFVVDYKTGTTKLSDWVIDTGLADPQVPLYLMALDEVPIGMAFGKLKVGEVGYQGVSGFPLGINGVSEMSKASRGAFKDYSSWSSLVNGWRREISRIAGEFAAGEAAVAPRHRGECDFCHLKSFCRIDERKTL
jgi:probable DNA repair protein